MTTREAANMSSIQDLIKHFENERDAVEEYAGCRYEPTYRAYAKGILEAYADILTGLYAVEENRR